MAKEILIIIITIFFLFNVANFVFKIGFTYGMETLHKEEYKCETLPDGEVHCWNVKDEKESN